LIGTEIPIGARILAVVDCFDALTSDRPYRARMGDAEALAIITERRGTMYDPLVVDTFLQIYPELRTPEHNGEPGELPTAVPSNTSAPDTSHGDPSPHLRPIRDPSTSRIA
jgi:HD-GYP domain-containing protein (c-di-GMP phosphodiesterase class II)